MPKVIIFGLMVQLKLIHSYLFITTKGYECIVAENASLSYSFFFYLHFLFCHLVDSEYDLKCLASDVVR